MADKPNRPRNYMITIHQGAKCFDECMEIARSAKTKCWAGIIHDQDMEIKEDGSLEPAPLHKHIVIEFLNGSTPSAVCKRFAGAHVDVINDVKGAYRYLIHNTEKSREKYQYSPDKIITDFPSAVKAILEEPEAKEAFEFFDESKYMEYMVDGITNVWAFCKRFGLLAWKKYGHAYMEVVAFAKTDTRAGEELMKIANDRAKERNDYPWEEEDEN